MGRAFMIGRRGFLGALAGLPMAAVLPKVSAPKSRALPQTFKIAAPEVTMGQPRFERGQVVVTITCDTRAMRRDIARVQADVERAMKQRAIMRPVMR